MPVTITIDGKQIAARPEATVLEAAREAGIAIPTLCHMEGMAPRTSCFLCAVRVEGFESLQPACALSVAEGMVVEAHSEEVCDARRMALELLFSDHAGRCVAPCAMACPLRFDAPRFLALLSAGSPIEAAALARRELILPATLGRVCRKHCESACVMREIGESISIRALHGFVAECDLASAGGAASLPERPAPMGRRVAVVGAGPAGLAAAFELACQGADCLLLDAADRAGGLLRRLSRERLDPAILDAEIALIERMGVEIHLGWRLGEAGTLADLRGAFDAVIVACGLGEDTRDEAAAGKHGKPKRIFAPEQLALFETQGLEASPKGIASSRSGFATSLEGVFAAGECAQGASVAVRAIASGRQAAAAALQFVQGEPAVGLPRPFYFQRIERDDAEKQAAHGDATPDSLFGAARDGKAARAEAGRCLQCSCAAEKTCRLRHYGAQYGARPYRFSGESRRLGPTDASHEEIVYEPGKCILCGLCVRIAEEAGEERGLSFSGRGFRTRVVVPLGATVREGLRQAARRCADACPTAALSVKKSPLCASHRERES